MSARYRLAGIPGGEAADGNGSGAGNRVLLDRRPDGGVGYPGAGGGLLWRQFRELIGGRNAARVDLADVHPLPLCGCVDGSGTVGERYVELPGDGARGGVAPEERWGGHVGRKDRAVGRIVDDDAGGPVLRAGRRHTEPGQK